MTVEQSIKQSKYARAKKDWVRQRVVYAICIFSAFIVPCVAINYACTKAVAQKPAALISNSSCGDTAGIYFPTVITSFNAGTLSVNQAHFIQVCDQVYVSGTFGGSNAIDTSQSSYVKFTLPVPSDLTLPPSSNAVGQGIVLQFGQQQLIDAALGFLSVSGPSGIAVSWHATRVSAYSIAYTFSYTVK